MSIAKMAEVASQMVRPSRASEIQSRLGTLTPAVVPLKVKMQSCEGSVL
jgi:hypothetical protein